MNSVSNTLQSLVQIIACLLLLYLAYTYYSSKEEHGKLFGLGLTFLGLSFASWSASTLLWTSPIIDYKNLAYTLQLASIFVFIGCGIYLTNKKYQHALNIILIIVSSAFALFLLINPYLSGATIYSLRYYFSFTNPTTVNIYAIISSISLVLATFAVAPKKSSRKSYLDGVRVGFILLAISLAIRMTSSDDAIRNINTALLLIVLTYLAIAHSKTLLKK